MHGYVCIFSDIYAVQRLMQVVTAKVKGHGGLVEGWAVKLYMHISVHYS